MPSVPSTITTHLFVVVNQDELLRKPASETALAAQITPLGTRPHKYTLHLLDNKTRHASTIPTHPDTLSTRLQVMLYHRLLSALISSSHPLNFSYLWTRLKLNASKPFSPSFMAQARLTWDSPLMGAQLCLDDLTRIWRHELQQLDVTGVEKAVQLVYRHRKLKKGKRIGKTASVGAIMERPEKEAENMAIAMEASMQDLEDSQERELARVIAESFEDLRRHLPESSTSHIPERPSKLRERASESVVVMAHGVSRSDSVQTVSTNMVTDSDDLAGELRCVHCVTRHADFLYISRRHHRFIFWGFHFQASAAHKA